MNKKLALLTVLATFFAHTITAQEVGIKGGLNFSNFYVDNIDDKSAFIGFHGGLYSKWLIGSIIGIQAELLYSG